MKELISFQFGDPKWQTFAEADRLAIALGYEGIPARFKIEGDMLCVLVPCGQIEEAAAVAGLIAA